MAGILPIRRKTQNNQSINWATPVIYLHMQIPCQTKCQVDAGFARMKRKYRRKFNTTMFDEISKYTVDLWYIFTLCAPCCDTLQHDFEAMSQSSKGNEAAITQNGTVKYREWKKSLYKLLSYN